jgi:hypothetical protein
MLSDLGFEVRTDKWWKWRLCDKELGSFSVSELWHNFAEHFFHLNFLNLAPLYKVGQHRIYACTTYPSLAFWGFLAAFTTFSNLHHSFPIPLVVTNTGTAASPLRPPPNQYVYFSRVMCTRHGRKTSKPHRHVSRHCCFGLQERAGWRVGWMEGGWVSRRSQKIMRHVTF